MTCPTQIVAQGGPLVSLVVGSRFPFNEQMIRFEYALKVVLSPDVPRGAREPKTVGKVSEVGWGRAAFDVYSAGAHRISLRALGARRC